MKLIDLSREIHHMMQRLPNHPMAIISQFTGHDERPVTDGCEFSSAVLSLNMGDRSGAPVHFDERPGAKSIAELPPDDFFTEAVCLGLSHKPLNSDILIAFIGFPLKIKGGTGSPVHSVAMQEE
jgi:kynurenine formamidase